MPRVALRCLELMRDKNANFASLAEVISQDPVMTTRVLRLVNSAAFSRRMVVTRLEQTVSQLGFSALRLAVVEMAAAEAFTSRNEGIRTRFKVVWEHCLAVAILAQEVAPFTGGRTDPSDAYVVGLLHDIGKPVVGVLLLEAERQLRTEAEAQWMSEVVWERTVHDTHRRVGAEIADLWRLPEAVVSAIRDLSSYQPLAGKSCQNVVRYANAIAKREGIYLGPVDIDEVEVAIQEGRHFLGVSVAQEQIWIQQLRKRTEAVTRQATPPRSGSPPRRG
jgi:putative nucleotidyltransferase with HDIG domain